MKRIITVLAVMGLMAAMVAASAMPAFAAVKGTYVDGGCDGPKTGVYCSTETSVGGSGEKGGGSGGKSTLDRSTDFNPPASDFYDGSSQGGGKGTGGGNCTYIGTYTYDEEGNFVSKPLLEGNGSRCN